MPYIDEVIIVNSHIENSIAQVFQVYNSQIIHSTIYCPRVLHSFLCNIDIVDINNYYRYIRSPKEDFNKKKSK